MSSRNGSNKSVSAAESVTPICVLRSGCLGSIPTNVSVEHYVKGKHVVCKECKSVGKDFKFRAPSGLSLRPRVPVAGIGGVVGLSHIT